MRVSSRKLEMISGMFCAGKVYMPTSSQFLAMGFMPEDCLVELAERPAEGRKLTEQDSILVNDLLTMLLGDCGGDAAAARKLLATMNSRKMNAREKIVASSLSMFIEIEERRIFIRRARAEVRRYEDIIPTAGSWGPSTYRRQAMTV